MFDHKHNQGELLSATTAIVVATVQRGFDAGGHQPVEDLIARTYAALAATAAAPIEKSVPASVEHEPATTVRKSLANPDHIISMIDGRPYKALKRHLTKNGLTPAEYRARYGLPASYPMTAPNYSAQRSEMAKKSGLGRKG